MIKVIILVCSLSIPHSDCELKNSLSHWTAGKTNSTMGCGVESMVDLGKVPSLTDPACTYEKVVCPDPKDPRYKMFYIK